MVGVFVGYNSAYMVVYEEGTVQWVGSRETSGAQKNLDNTVSHALGLMVSEAGMSGEPAWISSSGASGVVRMVEFPDMEEGEVEGAARFEAEEMVSRDISEMDVDAAVVEQTEEEGLRVMVAAAPRKLNDAKMGLLNGAGLTCQGVTTAVAALTASFQSAGEPESPGTVMLRADEEHCNMIVFSGTNPRVLRMIHHGTSGEEGEGDEEGGGSEDLSERLQDTVSRLSRSVQRSIEREARRDTDIENYRVYMCGEASSRPDLKEGLEERLGDTIRYFDPFKGLEVDCALPVEAAERSCYALACGAALMGAAEC